MCILFPNTCSYFYPCHLSLANTKHRRQKGVPVGIGTLRVDNTFLLAAPRIEIQGQSKLCKSQKEVPINQYMGVAPFILFLGYEFCPWGMSSAPGNHWTRYNHQPSCNIMFVQVRKRNSHICKVPADSKRSCVPGSKLPRLGVIPSLI